MPRSTENCFLYTGRLNEELKNPVEMFFISEIYTLEGLKARMPSNQGRWL